MFPDGRRRGKSRQQQDDHPHICHVVVAREAVGEPDSGVTEGLHSHEQGNVLIDVGELLLAVEIGDHGGEYRPDAAHAHAVPHYEQDDVEQGMGQEDAGQRQRIAQEQQLRGEQRSGAVTDPCLLYTSDAADE